MNCPAVLAAADLFRYSYMLLSFRRTCYYKSGMPCRQPIPNPASWQVPARQSFPRQHRPTSQSQRGLFSGGITNSVGSRRCASSLQGSQGVSSPERKRPEDVDANYRRVDFSEVHAYEARMAFLKNISRGEAAVDLADAAFQIAAEDDALVSHSSVKLPVEAFHSRLGRIADEVAELRLKPLLAKGAGDVELLEAVQQYVLRDKGFRPTAFGRSNVPGHSLVDSPGVWEDARNGYLNEVLIRRQGIPALLLILVADLLKRLLQRGVIDFVARQDVSDLGALPQGELLWGMGRSAVLASDGTVLNTCSSDTLVEVLRFLKRAYWPFPWDSHSGGFVGAAEAAVEGQQSSAELEAIARTAQHRLERGIWTSPGAGDLRRAVAAAERLVLLCGDRYPKERRDLAVLYLHCGRPEQARLELEHFAKRAAKEQEKAPLWQSLHDQTLVDKLLQALRAATPLASQDRPLASSGARSSGLGSSTVQLLTVELALRQPPPLADDGRRLPLTW